MSAYLYLLSLSRISCHLLVTYDIWVLCHNCGRSFGCSSIESQVTSRHRSCCHLCRSLCRYVLTDLGKSQFTKLISQAKQTEISNIQHHNTLTVAGSKTSRTSHKQPHKHLNFVWTMAPLAVITSDQNEARTYPQYVEVHETSLRISSAEFDHAQCQDHSITSPKLRRYPLAAPSIPKINRVAESPVSNQRRRVRFAPEDRIETVPHLSEMTESELDARWLTSSECKQIKSGCKITVHMMMAGQSIPKNDDAFCTRGLEIRTKLGARQRYAKRDKARRALFRAQHFQQREGFLDEQYLSELYMRYTAACCKEAFLRGLSDQREASR